MKEIVIVNNGGILIQGKHLLIHRSNKQFFEELLNYFDKIIIPQFLHLFQNSLSDLKVSDIPNLKVKSLNFSYNHKSIIHKILNYIAASFKMLPLVGSNRFFYIYFPGALPTIVLVLCFLFRKEYALYVRGDWLTSKNFLVERFYGFLFSKACFLLVTGENYRDLIKPWNTNTETVIPMINMNRDDIYYRDSYKLSSRCINLLFLSRVEKSKGIFHLLKSFEKLLNQDSRLHLTIAGDGPDIELLKALCNKKGLIESVSIMGLVQDQEKIKTIYKTADIFIFPSSYPEGFPRVLYEAMTFGLPIITTFVGAIGSVMQDDFNCLRVNHLDTGDLDEKILKLLCDENLRMKIGKNATETMVRLFKDFHTNSHAKQLIELMKSTDVQFCSKN